MERIKVKVKILPFEYFAEVELKFNKDLEVELPESSTISDLFKDLHKNLGGFFQRNIYNLETSCFVDTTILFVNGKPLQNLDGLDTKLFNGDMIIIGKMYSGG